MPDLPDLTNLERWAELVRRVITPVPRLVVAPLYNRIARRPIPQNVLRALACLYAPLEPLERCGEIYPVLLVSQTPFILEKGPDPVLVPPEGGWIRQSPESLFVRKRLFRFSRLLMGAPIDALENYRATRINSPQIEAALGRYDLMMDTSDMLAFELRRRLPGICKSESLTSDDLLRQLPSRRKLHARIPNPALDGEGRSSSISISVLTAYLHDGIWRLLVRRRASRGVAVDSGLLHVIPSFMLAPEHGAYDEEFSIRHNVRREFAEELFRLEAPKDAEPIWFERTPPVQDLDSMLDTGAAALWVTGVVINVLTLRPEVCVLLMISDDSWYSRSVDPTSGYELRINPEFASPRELQQLPLDQPGPGKNIRFETGCTDEELLRRSFMTAMNSVPVGAAAFWLGIDVLRRELARLA